MPPIPQTGFLGGKICHRRLNIEGINRSPLGARRVMEKASEAQKAEKETAVALIERGWEVSKSAGDAAEWNADDLDDDF